MSIVAIIGSATPPGRLRRAVAEALDRSPAETQLFDLAEHPLPFAGSAHFEAPILDAVATADAVLLATPVYRGTYTGVLKNLLDLLPVEALQGKPAAIAAMGATDHHSLGPDWHLRDTLAWFGALTLPTSAYLSSRDFTDGVPGDRGVAELDELLAGLAALADALPEGVTLGPAPLAARARATPRGG
ncbi:NAD(P)H-dependent oxidoreductase [Solirubrobacter phytolaccae]|uniref:NAD(P)H-dependent oxidoreductase n=1 Tax=Solirubrobacter phytolaccae TaxID=1404360 RepID=A0A9X3NDP2_9ACTN|nr:NAD(P)H-dependent oxidoreductase [Solirubrobacter phytolaccae]MDA0184141.1 NAD(P)H-dependent oxidoreductase [Solirubrobacter phytolaccae]